MLFWNDGYLFRGSSLLRGTRRLVSPLSINFFLWVLVFLFFIYIFFISIPGITKFILWAVGRRVPKNGTLTQFISFLDGSHWKSFLDYFDLKPSTFQLKGKTFNLQRNQIRWKDVLDWVYRNFIFIATGAWFTFMCKEVNKWIASFKARLRVFFKNVENKNYFESLSNLKALIAVQSMNLLLIS